MAIKFPLKSLNFPTNSPVISTSPIPFISLGKDSFLCSVKGGISKFANSFSLEVNLSIFILKVVFSVNGNPFMSRFPLNNVLLSNFILKFFDLKSATVPSNFPEISAVLSIPSKKEVKYPMSLKFSLDSLK